MVTRLHRTVPLGCDANIGLYDSDEKMCDIRVAHSLPYEGDMLGAVNFDRRQGDETER